MTLLRALLALLLQALIAKQLPASLALLLQALVSQLSLFNIKVTYETKDNLPTHEAVHDDLRLHVQMVHILPNQPTNKAGILQPKPPDNFKVEEVIYVDEEVLAEVRSKPGGVLDDGAPWERLKWRSGLRD